MTDDSARERIAADRLGQLRNNISIAGLIQCNLGLPWKHSEGYFRFLCPLCNEFHTATNPKTNLARCFRCNQNFNPIDIVMIVERCSFREAVRFLTNLEKK